MNYSARRQPVAGLEMAFVAHLEEDVPAAAAKAVAIAREMRVVIAMATRYADQLREQGAGDVRVICPGVDLERFRPSIRVGVIGRTYHTGRKGEALVREVLDEPGIEWQFTGDGWPRPGTAVAEADMPAFYRSLDYVLVPARYEGGPMSVLEALASGVEVIAPDIGFVEDYPHIPYRKNDAGDLRRVLRALVATREARHAAVASRTWEAWADAHDRVFTEVLAEVPVTRPTPARLAAARAALGCDRQPAIGTATATGNRQPATALGAPDADGRLKVLLCLHDPERVAAVGGPSIRVRRMQAALASVGIDADLAEAELPDTSGYDLAHVFNVWEPESARRQLQHLRDQGCPVVFSPILLDLFEGLWSQRALLPLFRGRRPPEVIERDLDRLLTTPMDVRRALGAGLSAGVGAMAGDGARSRRSGRPPARAQPARDCAPRRVPRAVAPLLAGAQRSGPRLAGHRSGRGVPRACRRGRLRAVRGSRGAPQEPAPAGLGPPRHRPRPRLAGRDAQAGVRGAGAVGAGRPCPFRPAARARRPAAGLCLRRRARVRAPELERRDAALGAGGGGRRDAPRAERSVRRARVARTVRPLLRSRPTGATSGAP